MTKFSKSHKLQVPAVPEYGTAKQRFAEISGFEQKVSKVPSNEFEKGTIEK
jgi:hypothetical protein